MTQSKTRRIRQAIEPILESWEIKNYLDEHDRLSDFTHELVEAIKPLLSEKKKESLNSLLYSVEANDAVERIGAMISHVEKVLGAPGCIDMGGSGKWERAIKYLIKVKEKNGWDFEVLWLYLDSEEIKFEKEKLSYGLLMKNPHAQLKAWMPRAHAESEKPKTEREKVNDAFANYEQDAAEDIIDV